MARKKSPAPAEEKIDIAKLTLEELRELLERAEKDKAKCDKCDKCICDSHNFTKRYNLGCGEIFAVIKAEKEIREEEKAKKQSSTQNTETLQLSEPYCCDNCKHLESNYLDKGYCFCSHWHNFTDLNGYCYAYEPSKGSVETCG